MQRLLELFRHFSQHQKQGFFYNRENQKFRERFDSVRAHAAFNNGNSL